LTIIIYYKIIKIRRKVNHTQKRTKRKSAIISNFLFGRVPQVSYRFVDIAQEDFAQRLPMQENDWYKQA